jgi:Flp pilus assembly protein TadG
MIKNKNVRTAVLKKLCGFGAGAQGVAGIEFALTGTVLAVGLLNAVDVGYYIYRRMEVENAANAGVQAAYNTCVPPCTPQNCPSQQLPATQNCSALNAAITSAIQSTSLGTAVTLASGYPEEGDYCINASNILQCVGSLSNPAPGSCSATGQQQTCAAAGNANVSPSDYLLVQVTYPYQPLFPGLSVMSGLGWTSINKTSWMRLG